MTNDKAIVASAVILGLLACLVGFYIPYWNNESLKKGYDHGYSDGKVGEHLAFIDGFQKGTHLQKMSDEDGYRLNPYSNGDLYCNATTCIHYDNTYNVKFTFGAR